MIIRNAKEEQFRLTARKGTPRARGKKLQGVAPQSDLRIDKEEGYDVELSICGKRSIGIQVDIKSGADPGISKGGCTIRDIHVYIIQSVLA